ncbi:hypothetical protein V7S43_013003 [Phytophthora oleae]|uniref:Uncharacterized protein n=1 Tax=Phytophthora oleae TaxID=2107226 RepID=A0ABD3F7D6_9STRA
MLEVRAQLPGAVTAASGYPDLAMPSQSGINSNGTCYPLLKSYLGAYLRDPDNTDENCESPCNSSTAHELVQLLYGRYLV